MKRVSVLTIAGSDSGGGAGIQADLKTFAALGVFGASAITAVTAQNLERVAAVEAVTPGLVAAQIEAVIKGFKVLAAKTGMLCNAALIKTVAEVLRANQPLPLVLDPVFTASSGGVLLEKTAVLVMVEELFPLAALLTPNVHEAGWLTGRVLRDQDDLLWAAEQLLSAHGVPVLVKGGDLGLDQAVDVLACPGRTILKSNAFIRNVNTHGSGCTLAAAVTAFLACGLDLEAAVDAARNYVHQCLAHPLELFGGVFLLDHSQGRFVNQAE